MLQRSAATQVVQVCMRMSAVAWHFDMVWVHDDSTNMGILIVFLSLSEACTRQ